MPAERRWWRRVAGSNIVFCLALATAMLVTRLVAFDGEMLFQLRFVPNHDMAAAIPFFTTNVHAARTTGDIAWWNPVAYGGHGYPQYYQSFLSPMAPTSGHIVMIGWMQMIRALAAIGVTIPEYKQYLIVTYGVLPFLTFFSFSVFASLIFRRRSTVALVAAAYAFSGIGLWNSAWFYFQESFTLFFLLAAWLALLRRPTAPRASVLIAAILVQLTSLNYWTIYNSWFVLLLVSSHAWIYRNQVMRAFLRLRQWIPTHRAPTAGTIALVAAVAISWLAIVGSIAHEQSGSNFRPSYALSNGLGGNGVQPRQEYTAEFAYSRIPETRWFTGGLFNPKLDRVLDSTPIRNPMHDARYIGVAFLPLLILLPLTRWRRRERWLAVSAVGVLCVCIAPPILLAAWKATPGMDRVLHVFFFYSHFWQLLVVLLGGSVFDRLVGPLPAIAWKRITPVLTGLITVAGLALLVIGLTSERYPEGSGTIERITRAGLLLVVGSGLLLQCKFALRSGPRPAFAWIFVAIATADLSRYFYEVSRADHEFTRQFRQNVPYPLPPDVVARLRCPWPKVDPAAGFAGGLFANLPIGTEFWPDNRYLVPRPFWYSWYPLAATGIWNATSSPVLFFDRAESVAADAVLSTDVDYDPDRFYSTLVLHDGNGCIDSIDDANGKPSTIPHQFTHWSYNDFGLTVDAPSQGWLLLHQTYDPRWRISIDGQPTTVTRANQFRMAVAIPPGRHSLVMSYRPFARSLYWPACWLLEGGLAILSISAWRARRHVSRLPLSDVKSRRIAA